MSSYHATPMNQPRSPPMKKPDTAIITLSIIAPRKEKLLRQPQSLRQSRRGINQRALATPRQGAASNYAGGRKADQCGDCSRFFARATAVARIEGESNGDAHSEKSPHTSADDAEYRFFPAARRRHAPDVFHFVAREALVLSLPFDHQFRVGQADQLP